MSHNFLLSRPTNQIHHRNELNMHIRSIFSFSFLILPISNQTIFANNLTYHIFSESADSMSLSTRLRAIRRVFADANVTPYTSGLNNQEIAAFQNDENLNLAVKRASEVFPKLMKEYPKLYVQSEKTLSPILQKDLLQFYDSVVRRLKKRV